MSEIRIPPGLGREPSPVRPRRFYRLAAATARASGFALELDGRGAKTPAKRDLVLPSEAVAAAVAREWNAQGELIDPGAMPLTRLANSAVDGVADQMVATAGEVKAYVSCDLLLYRAGDPAPLVAEETRLWDPVIDWAGDTFGARFVLAEGISFVTQPPATLTAMAEAVDAAVGSGPAAPFRLAALHVMTTLTGSALLALSVVGRHLSAEDAWTAAHVDELFQESRWGRDAEALERRDRRWTEMAAAATLARLAGPDP